MPAVRRLEPLYREHVHFKWVNILRADSAPWMEKYAFSSTPEIYLVDAQDQVIGFWDDALALDSLQEAIESALLGEP